MHPEPEYVMCKGFGGEYKSILNLLDLHDRSTMFKYLNIIYPGKEEIFTTYP